MRGYAECNRSVESPKAIPQKAGAVVIAFHFHSKKNIAKQKPRAKRMK